MPISDLEPLTKIKAGSYKLLPAPLKDNVFPFVLHTDTGDWKTADRDQSDTSRFPCGGQCSSTVSLASKKSGSIVTRVARGLYGVSSTQSLRYNNQNQQPVAVILTGQNTLVGLNNARDLPRKLNSEDDVRPDISLPVPSTDTVDKTDANLLVVMRAAERVVLILQIPIVTSREGRDVSTITDVVSGIVGSTKTIYVNDVRELVDPHSHAKVALPFAQGGGSLLYLVSTVPVRLPAAYADAMSRATQQALSNLEPQLRALDSNRIPWYGYIKPPANAADATVDYIDDDAKIIYYHEATAATNEPATASPDTPSSPVRKTVDVVITPQTKEPETSTAEPNITPTDPGLYPGIFAGLGILCLIVFIMMIIGQHQSVEFFMRPTSLMITTMLGIAAQLMLATILPYYAGTHGVLGGLLVFITFLIPFVDNTIREVATFKHGTPAAAALSASLLFPLFHNSFEAPPGSLSTLLLTAGLVGMSMVSNNDILPENPMPVVEAVAPAPTTE